MLTDTEILARRGLGTHANLKCWNRPHGCSCDTTPIMEFREVKAEWVAWMEERNGNAEFPIEVDSD